MAKLKPAIGIYGGTFDPIHFGHLRPTLEVCQSLNLKQIRFIPSYISPHKGIPSSSVNQRLLMLKKAIAGEKKFILDDREMQREGKSYTIDTLISLKKDFPLHPLCLILGLDAFLHINTWHRWEELLSYSHLVITHRPETSQDQVSSWPKIIQDMYQQNKVDHAEQLFEQERGKIFFINVTQLSISSSQIRHYLKLNQSIRYLLPDDVYDIIQSKQLYNTK